MTPRRTATRKLHDDFFGVRSISADCTIVLTVKLPTSGGSRLERVFDWWRTAKGRICSEQERTPIGGARRESDDFNGLDDGGLQTQVILKLHNSPSNSTLSE